MKLMNWDRLLDISPRKILKKLGMKFNEKNEPVILSRYDYLVKYIVDQNSINMIEIGVWKGDRAEQFIQNVKSLKHYVGFDLFENISKDTFKSESMGKCYPASMEIVNERLKKIARMDCKIELIPGNTKITLKQFQSQTDEKFDFIFIDGGHSIQTIENDWEFSEKLISQKGIIILDDYYLNDESRGARSLIDRLLNNKQYEVRFFPMIEDIIDNLQITMVIVKKN